METQAGNGSKEGGTESQGHRVGGARVSDVSNIHPKPLLLGYPSAWFMLPMASAEVSWMCFFSSTPTRHTLNVSTSLSPASLSAEQGYFYLCPPHPGPSGHLLATFVLATIQSDNALECRPDQTKPFLGFNDSVSSFCSQDQVQWPAIPVFPV